MVEMRKGANPSKIKNKKDVNERRRNEHTYKVGAKHPNKIVSIVNMYSDTQNISRYLLSF